MTILQRELTEPHYHVWTMYRVALPWPGFSDGARMMDTLVYVPERMAYNTRQNAQKHSPRYDANPNYGKSAGMVRQCDGGDACPTHIEPFPGTERLECHNCQTMTHVYTATEAKRFIDHHFGNCGVA